MKQSRNRINIKIENETSRKNRNGNRIKMVIGIVIGIIGILYGIRVGLLHTGSSFFLVWIGLGLLALFYAAGVHLQIADHFPMIVRKIVLILVLICLCFFILIEGMIISSFHASGSSQLDYLVVLGAQVRKSGPSVVLQYRLNQAIAYLEENPDTICIVSGGKGKTEPMTEAEGMYEYLVEHGIKSDRIRKEDASTNTEQNIKNSMKLMTDPASAKVGIVTNNFHVFRGLHIAKKQGIVNAEGIAAKSTALFLPNNLFREFFGVIKDFIKGNI